MTHHLQWHFRQIKFIAMLTLCNAANVMVWCDDMLLHETTDASSKLLAKVMVMRMTLTVTLIVTATVDDGNDDDSSHSTDDPVTHAAMQVTCCFVWLTAGFLNLRSGEANVFQFQFNDGSCKQS